MKKSLLLIPILVFLFLKTNAFAVSSAVSITITAVQTESRTKIAPASRAAAKETNLKKRADKEIDRRIKSLNNLVTKVGALKRLTADQKSLLRSQVESEIANLTALKTKIDGDTDASILKTDVQSVVKSYRVYALFLPKINILAASDQILNITDKLSSVSAKLEIQTQQAQKNETVF